MSVTYICGHIHPDTDSIASAIALEEFYNVQGQPVIAVRGGELNPEASWVLERFSVSSPPEIRDVRTQVRDLDYDRPTFIRPEEPIARAWQLMQESDTKSIPVVDQRGHLAGIITSGNVAAADLGYTLGEALTLSLSNLADALRARIFGRHQEQFDAPIAIHTSSAAVPEGVVLFTTRLSADLIEDAIAHQAPAIIECGSQLSSAAQMQAWDERYRSHITLLQTEDDLYTAIRRAQVSAPVATAMTATPLVAFEENDFLDDVTQKMLSTRYRAYPVTNRRGEVLGMMSRYHLLQPKRKRVILVDHNEVSQAVRGLEQAEILGIVDHHRLGDIETSSPIFVRNEPVGCTSTIIYSMFREQGITPSPRAAGLMLCAILSDTVEFKSPTCTPRDIETAEALAEITGVEIQSLAREMFSLAGHLRDRSLREILYLDFKEFVFSDLKVGVSQISSADFSEIEDRLAGMPSILRDSVEQQRFDLMLFMATDIGHEGTHLYYAGSPDAVRALGQAFHVELDQASGAFFLPGVMSRKKQVIPRIAESLG